MDNRMDTSLHRKKKGAKTTMKHNLINEYRKTNLLGKDILQPIINELQDKLANGRTYIKIIEILGEPKEQKQQ